ncbi:MAG: hypothetical protein IID37_09165 [Planctomycetes bacterium]|nr:hypothetical protein [Planctomycetota bacterium]
MQGSTPGMDTLDRAGPKIGPRTTSALVLVAHGKTSDTAIPDGLDVHAERITRRSVADHMLTAYLAHPPYVSNLHERFDELRAKQAVIVPLFTGAGYYVDVALPRALEPPGAAAGVNDCTIRLTPPVGDHPEIGSLLADAARRAMAAACFEARRTAVVLCGHGTLRHPASGESTHRHAEHMATVLDVSAVVAVFLDQPPQIEDVYDLTPAKNLVVVPDLVGGGRHAVEDLPHRLGLPSGGFMKTAQVHDRSIIVTEPVYGNESVTELMITLARGSGIPLRTGDKDGPP